MSAEVGSIVEGIVTGIAKFGAFVELPDKSVGLVHISEVANEYVTDVNQHLKVDDKVQVKVISMDDKGKIALSIKQAQPQQEVSRPRRESSFRSDGQRGRQDFRERRGAGRKPTGAMSFEDKLSRFLKDSEDRLSDLKRNTESKRGGRGARRSD